MKTMIRIPKFILSKLFTKIVLFFFLFQLNNHLTAQPATEWVQNYGGSSNDSAHSVQQTADGGYIVAGNSYSNDGDVGGNNGGTSLFFTDFWIIKLDEQGNLQWEQNYGGDNHDSARSVWQTADGGYIVAGFSWSNNGDVGGNNGNEDFWIIKLDEQGILQWEQNYGGSSLDIANSVQQTNDGGYIVAGTSNSDDGNVEENNGSFDSWILKLNEQGSLQWAKNYGSSNDDYTRSVQQTTDGGYIIGGLSNSNDGDVGGNNGDLDCWIIKLDEIGNLQWKQNYGGSSEDNINSIQQTTDGGYIVAGNSYSNDGDVGGNNGDLDSWILKLDEQGNLQWEQSYGGSDEEDFRSVQQTSDGGYIAAGLSKSNDGDVVGNNGDSDFWIIKVDEQGNLQWEQNYGGADSDYANSIQRTNNGGYIVVGDSWSNDGDAEGNNGLSDFWIIKLSAENLGVNVWPGDLNYDGIVNNEDQSISYFYYNENGPHRTPGGIAWEAQACENWDIPQPNGYDIKHHDCDGNGNINTNDANAINLNYGKTHPLPPGIIPSLTPIYTNTDFQILLQPINELSPNNNTVIMNVVMDSKSGQNLEVFGGHFSIDYSNIIDNVDAAVMNFESLSWLGNPGINLLAESWHNVIENTIEVGFTKTNGISSTGKGVIGKVTFLLNANNLNRSNSCENLLDVAITKIGSFNAQQDSLQIEEEFRTVNLGMSCCESFINLSKSTPFQNLYQSSGNIVTNGYLPIGQNQRVEYNGASRVTLNTGFNVKAGADFKVRSSGCN